MRSAPEPRAGSSRDSQTSSRCTTTRPPLSVSAGQILGEVNAGRAPKHLPTATDFDAESHGLGAVYESAWMIFRMLGERYGDARVVGFYQAVMGGSELGDALRTSFGLTVDQLTTSWRDYLAKSASTVS